MKEYESQKMGYLTNEKTLNRVKISLIQTIMIIYIVTTIFLLARTTDINLLKKCKLIHYVKISKLIKNSI